MGNYAHGVEVMVLDCATNSALPQGSRDGWASSGRKKGFLARYALYDSHKPHRTLFKAKKY